MGQDRTPNNNYNRDISTLNYNKKKPKERKSKWNRLQIVTFDSEIAILLRSKCWQSPPSGNIPSKGMDRQTAFRILLERGWDFILVTTILANLYFLCPSIFSGNYAPIIVPPSWIVKLPSKGNFKSSIRVNNKGQPNDKGKKGKLASKRSQKGDRKDQRAFIVKPIPSTEVIPVIVYINPKSGGNQGVKLLGKFQHLLNPRQVFDLTQGGPKMG